MKAAHWTMLTNRPEPNKHWHTYDELAARNAGRVFERMEFE